MNAGLYQGAAALTASERRMDVIAHNLANVDTVGYKRQGTAAHAFRVPGANGPREGLGSVRTTDWSQGNLERTQNPYYLALFGDGFLALDAPEGEVYVRGGQFQTDPEGVLTSREGYPVVWERKSGPIDPAGLPVVIDAEGQVMQGENELGRLRLVDFDGRAGFRQTTDGYWEAPPGARRKTHTAAVHQGALERSNSVGLEEVVAMVTVQRSFEAASNVMSAIDKSYRRLTQSSA